MRGSRILIYARQASRCGVGVMFADNGFGNMLPTERLVPVASCVPNAREGKPLAPSAGMRQRGFWKFVGRRPTAPLQSETGNDGNT
jgi:hypothetical protein